MAATESLIGITPGSGQYLHVAARAVASTSTEEQYVVPAEGTLPTYTAIARGVRVNTANSHLLFVQGDGTNYVRLRRVKIRQANIATASTLDIRVLRTSTAGGGTGAISARAFDTADTTPYAGTVQSLPSTKGTEGAELLSFRLGLTASNPITSANQEEWIAGRHNEKPIIVGNATTDGFCVKNIGSSATEVDVEAEFTTSSYL